MFKLQLGAWVDTVSRDRLKAHLGVVDPEVSSPRPRRQPPGAGVGYTLQTGPSKKGGLFSSLQMYKFWREKSSNDVFIKKSANGFL